MKKILNFDEKISIRMSFSTNKIKDYLSLAEAKIGAELGKTHKL